MVLNDMLDLYFHPLIICHQLWSPFGDLDYAYPTSISDSYNICPVNAPMTIEPQRKEL